MLLEKVDRTLESSRQAQDALNRDLNMKDVAFGIDQTCLVPITITTIMSSEGNSQSLITNHHLLKVTHNNSSEVALHSGIERVDQVKEVQQKPP